jgi:hypothetical protein
VQVFELKSKWVLAGQATQVLPFQTGLSSGQSGFAGGGEELTLAVGAGTAVLHELSLQTHFNWAELKVYPAGQQMHFPAL